MTSKDYFGLAVRVIGFWFFVSGIYDILARIPKIVVFDAPQATLGMAFVGLSEGIASAMVGAWALQKTESIIRIVYGLHTSSRPPES